jgi:RNA polymerase sigma factor (sigma-70 family)
LHDAEDAFQATFLILVRKAATIAKRDTVANWLYGVAFRTAIKARGLAFHRRRKEKQMTRSQAIRDNDLCDLRELLDQEMNRLPTKYREPVVLCDLEGYTRKQAALRLGWPEGTLSVRLSRARELLGKRLTRRGVALGTGVLLVPLSRFAMTVPSALALSTGQAAALTAAGHATTGAASAQVVALTKGVLKDMFRSKLKIATAVVVALGVISISIGTYSTQITAAREPEEVKKASSVPENNGKKRGSSSEEEKLTLPTGSPPIQVLASLDKDGKLAIRMGWDPPGFAPAGAITYSTETFDVDDVKVLDTKGKQIDKKELANLLKKETVAMASLFGQPVDPRHLRLIKDGTLIFLLPKQKQAGPAGVPNGEGAPPGGAAAPPPRGGPVPPPDRAPARRPDAESIATIALDGDVALWNAAGAHVDPIVT